MDDDAMRREAGSCNNRAWTLIERPVLNTSDMADLVTLAGTARHLWHQVGTDNQRTHADLLFAWALARAGAAAPAVDLAGQVVEAFARDGAAWERGFAHAAMAAASAAQGDAGLHLHHHAEAARIGDSLSGPDARYFQAAFVTIPKPGG